MTVTSSSDKSESSSRAFVLERIRNFAGQDLDPDVDKDVEDMLRSKFRVHLPQRRSLEESLLATTSDHEIIALILQYRSLG